jgi:hypothetical protein
MISMTYAQAAKRFVSSGEMNPVDGSWCPDLEGAIIRAAVGAFPHVLLACAVKLGRFAGVTEKGA